MKSVLHKCYDDWGNLKDNALNIAFNLGKKEGLRKGKKQGRADAIEEYMNKLCDKCIQTPNECWNLECPFADDECQIVKIADELKE